MSEYLFERCLDIFIYNSFAMLDLLINLKKITN